MKKIMKKTDNNKISSFNGAHNDQSDADPIFIKILERLTNSIGNDYLKGKVITSHDDINHQIYTTLSSQKSDEKDLLSEYRKFTKFQIQKQLNNEFDKPLKNIAIPIPMEKNLLRTSDYSDYDIARMSLRKSIIRLTQSENLTEIQVLGLILGNLMLESGVIKLADQIAFLKSASSGLIAIDNMWFFEYRSQFLNSPTFGIRRFVLDPLSVCIFIINFKKIKHLELDKKSEKELSKLIEHAFKAVSDAGDNERISVSKYRNGAALEALIRLPGFIHQRVLGKCESYDLPLLVFARCADIKVVNTVIDDVNLQKDEDENDFDEESQDDEESPPGKSSTVRSNIITQLQFDSFIHWIMTHPSITNSERKQLEILYNLAFYCGFRRGEAKGLRLKDIYSELPIIAKLREYSGHSLKTGSSTRQALLEWLPPILLSSIVKLVKSSPNSSKPLIECYSEASFITTLFENANKYLQQYFRDSSLTVHSLRHSFTSLNLLKLMAGPLRIYDISGLSSLVDQALPDAARFTDSLIGNLNPSAKLLWSLAKSVGHIDPSTTLRSYTHIMDVLTFYGYAYSRPQGYYTRISEVTGVSNRQIHKYLEHYSAEGKHFQYNQSVSFSGRVPITLLKNLESANPDAVTRLTESWSGSSYFDGPDWKEILKHFNTSKNEALSQEFLDIIGDKNIDFIKGYLPISSDLNALLWLQKNLSFDFFNISLLKTLCRHYDRHQGLLSIRQGFPVKELAVALQKHGFSPEDFVLKAYGSSVLDKKTIPLKNNFSGLSRLNTNGQLIYRPNGHRRVPHSAIYWFFCANLMRRLQTPQ